MEGIFPRTYVNVVDETSGPPPSSYGNMPLEVSESGSGPAAVGPDGTKNTKFEQNGKKFGKKMGNAGMFPGDNADLLESAMLIMPLAIFGAGATIGSNIVNSVF